MSTNSNEQTNNIYSILNEDQIFYISSSANSSIRIIDTKSIKTVAKTLSGYNFNKTELLLNYADNLNKNKLDDLKSLKGKYCFIEYFITNGKITKINVIDISRLGNLINKFDGNAYKDFSFDIKREKMVTFFECFKFDENNNLLIEKRHSIYLQGVPELKDSALYLIEKISELLSSKTELEKEKEENEIKINELKSQYDQESKKILDNTEKRKAALAGCVEDIAMKKLEKEKIELDIKALTNDVKSAKAELEKIKKEQTEKAKLFTKAKEELEAIVSSIRNDPEISSQLLPLLSIFNHNHSNGNNKLIEESPKNASVTIATPVDSGKRNPIKSIEREISSDKLKFETLLSALQSADYSKLKINSSDLKKYLESKDLYYKEETLNQIINSYNNNRMAILSGRPGFGKSRLVTEFSRFINSSLKDKSAQDSTFQFISVKPEWVDTGYLMGGQNLITKELEITPLLKTMYLASKAPNCKFFVCFDEFNIARPENYFADFLSKMERNKEDREIKIWPHYILDDYPEDYFLPISENIHFFATINHDSTTFELSPKVLDRCDIINIEPTDKEDYDGYFKIKKIKGALETNLNLILKIWYDNNNMILPPPISFRSIDSINMKQITNTSELDLLFSSRILNNLPNTLYGNEYIKLLGNIINKLPSDFKLSKSKIKQVIIQQNSII